MDASVIHLVDQILMISSIFNFTFYTLCLIFVLFKVKGKVFLGLSLMLWLFFIFFLTRSLTDTFLYIA